MVKEIVFGGGVTNETIFVMNSDPLAIRILLEVSCSEHLLRTKVVAKALFEVRIFRGLLDRVDRTRVGPRDDLQEAEVEARSLSKRVWRKKKNEKEGRARPKPH